jgi:hypothetical protein
MMTHEPLHASSEDSFRSDLVDLLSLYRAVDKVGVNRVGIADTVGCASPRQVYDVSTCYPDTTGSMLIQCYSSSGRSGALFVCLSNPAHRILLTVASLRYRDTLPRRHGLQYRQCVCRPLALFGLRLLIPLSYCALEAGATHIDTSVLGSKCISFMSSIPCR